MTPNGIKNSKQIKSISDGGVTDTYLGIVFEERLECGQSHAGQLRIPFVVPEPAQVVGRPGVELILAPPTCTEE